MSWIPFFIFYFYFALVSFLSWWSGFGAWDFRLFLFAFSILAEWESSDTEPIFWFCLSEILLLLSVLPDLEWGWFSCTTAKSSGFRLKLRFLAVTLSLLIAIFAAFSAAPFSFEVYRSGVPGRRCVIDIAQISLPSIFVLGISWHPLVWMHICELNFCSNSFPVSFQRSKFHQR